MIIDQGLLDKVWRNWCTHQLYASMYSHQPNYARVPRRTSLAQRFELWLWHEGASIARKNKKCYLEFHTEDDATAFILRNG